MSLVEEESPSHDFSSMDVSSQSAYHYEHDHLNIRKATLNMEIPASLVTLVDVYHIWVLGAALICMVVVYIHTLCCTLHQW